MNFKRKSTVGWHIGNVLLDFTGGVFSLLQMVIDAINEQDPTVFFNFSKLGLALFSIGFDILFMIQHYLCYPQKKPSYQITIDEYGKIAESDEDSVSTNSSIQENAFNSVTNLFRRVSEGSNY